MKYKAFHDGQPVPVLGLGTAHYGASSERRSEVSTLRAALDMGYAHIDTAEAYGGGGSEIVIGEAIQGYDRSKLFLTSKVRGSHLRGEQVMEAIEGSLRRLDTEYLDLYLIHHPDPKVPLEETFEALNQLVEQGKVRYTGISNFDSDQMDKAYGLTKSILATNQVHYNLLVREPEDNGVLQYCQEHDVLLTAYSPLKNGVLQQQGVRRIADKHGASPAQIALAWLIAKDKVITIPQSHNVEHMRDNLGALDITLSAEDASSLDGLATGAMQVGR